MAPVSITESELLEALASATHGAGPEGARTTHELMAETNRSLHSVNKALKQLQASGRLLHHRVPRPAIDGVMRLVAAYTITPAKKKARG